MHLKIAFEQCLNSNMWALTSACGILFYTEITECAALCLCVCVATSNSYLQNLLTSQMLIIITAAFKLLTRLTHVKT